MPYTGEIAALSTAVFWTVSALCFSLAGQRIGSLAVNFLRLVVALLCYVAWCGITIGQPVPLTATPSAWLWFSLSGLVGLFFGDLCLFKAFLMIGPRVSMLIMSLAPPITALIGGVFLGEHLTWMNWIAMAVTLGGVAWVVSGEREASEQGATAHRFHWKGGVLALLGCLGQSVGTVLQKEGLSGVPSAFAGAQIRIIAAAVGFTVLLASLRWFPKVRAGLKDRRAVKQLLLGSVAGPFLGVSLMVVSIQHISAGLAQTFVATTPVLIIPLSAIIYRERIRPAAVIGAIIAGIGVALLFV
jgi:drug/metabolite transporter (DMT)-like permease